MIVNNNLNVLIDSNYYLIFYVVLKWTYYERYNWVSYSTFKVTM